MKDHSDLCKHRIQLGLELECTCDYKLIEPLLDRINKLEWAISKLVLNHHTCEDSWYSCPRSGNCFNDDMKGCNCGANKHNKFIKDILREGTEIRKKYFNER